MHTRFANRDEFAWERGEQAFVPGDNLSTAVQKAQQAGLRPGCNGYSAFITAFSRRIRQHQESRRETAEPSTSESAASATSATSATMPPATTIASQQTENLQAQAS